MKIVVISDTLDAGQKLARELRTETFGFPDFELTHVAPLQWAETEQDTNVLVVTDLPQAFLDGLCMTYADFIRTLHMYYPSAVIIVWSTTTPDELELYLERGASSVWRIDLPIKAISEQLLHYTGQLFD